MSKQWRGLFKKDYVKDDGTRVKVSDMLEGAARKEGEDFEKYKIRRAAERELLDDYLGGFMVPNEFDPITGKIKPRINPARQAKKELKLKYGSARQVRKARRLNG